MHSNHVSIQGAYCFAWGYAIFIVSCYEGGLLRSDCSSKRLVMLEAALMPIDGRKRQGGSMCGMWAQAYNRKS